MRALVCKDGGASLEDVGEPSPRPGEAILRVRSAGICNTDIELARGYMGFRGALGHEVIASVLGSEGAVPAELAGKRVALEINCACLRCPTCRAGGRNHCPNRTVLGILGRDGGIAEWVQIPIENLHAIPESVSDEAAAFVEPLAAALHAFDEAALKPGDRALILGDGKLGLLVGLCLAARRGDLSRAVCVGRHREKLALLEAAGLSVELEGGFREAGFDVVIEATGHPSGLAKALSALKPRGTLILKSTYAGDAGVDLAPIVINEIRVVGSRCGDFGRAVDALARGVIDPRPLISARYPLSEAERAFERAKEPGVLKVLVLPE